MISCGLGQREASMRGRVQAYNVSVLGLISLLIGCSSESPPSQPTENVAPSVEAPPPAQQLPQVSAALATEYQEARTAFDRVLDFDPIPDSPNDENKEIELAHCEIPFSVIPPREAVGWSRSLYLAYDAAYAAAILKAAGVPETYWNERLSQFERQTLPRFEGQYFRQEDLTENEDDTKKPDQSYINSVDDFMQQLVKDINASGVRQHGTFSYTSECGGNPYSEFEIEAAPEGPNLYLISRWSTLVCEGRGIPVYDRARCRGWRPVSTPSVEPLTGDLLYTSQWRDGSSSRGEISFRGRGSIGRVTITPRGVSYQPLLEDDY